MGVHRNENLVFKKYFFCLYVNGGIQENYLTYLFFSTSVKVYVSVYKESTFMCKQNCEAMVKLTCACIFTLVFLFFASV